MDYVDSCSTLEVLKMDSGLAPKPHPAWDTFIPKEGDIAYVSEDDSDYKFDEVTNTWIKILKE